VSTIKVSNLQNASAASPAIVLAADGSATANLSSVNGGALSGTRNRILNGDMRIDQRNAGAAQTIAASVLAFTLDRFAVYNGAGSSITTQRVAGIGAFQNALRITGSGGSAEFLQRIESANCYDLASSQATFSMYLVASANCTVSWYARHAGSADNFGSQTNITTGAFNVTTTPTLFTAIITLPAGAANGIQLGASATLSAAQTLSVTGVQLEPGTVATPFERRSYGAELALCQRYFEKSFDIETAPANGPNASNFANNIGIFGACALNGSTSSAYLAFKVQKRTIPTITGYGNNSGHWLSNGATWSATTFSPSMTGSHGTGFTQQTVGAISTIAGHWTASAEL